MNEFNITYNNHRNVKLIAEKNAVCVDRIPSDGIYESVIVSLFDDKGNRFDSQPTKRINNKFMIKFNNIRPGRYVMSCFKKDFVYEKYSRWFGRIPIIMHPNRMMSFEQSPVYMNNINCVQQITRQLVNKRINLGTSSPTIKNFAKNITRTCSSSYAATMFIHDCISQTISYDKDSYAKILRKESFNHAIVCDPLLVLSSKKGVCAGYSNLAVAMLTSIGIPAKTISCYALGFNTEGKWSKANIQAELNHVITAAWTDHGCVLMDITWDCVNDYQNGRIIPKKAFTREYFDPTLQFLSCTHKLLSIMDC